MNFRNYYWYTMLFASLKLYKITFKNWKDNYEKCTIIDKNWQIFINSLNIYKIDFQIFPWNNPKWMPPLIATMNGGQNNWSVITLGESVLIIASGHSDQNTPPEWSPASYFDPWWMKASSLSLPTPFHLTLNESHPHFFYPPLFL